MRRDNNAFSILIRKHMAGYMNKVGLYLMYNFCIETMKAIPSNYFVDKLITE